MMRLFKWILCAGLLASGLGETRAFSLLGRFKDAANGAPIPWQGPGFGGQPQGLGYELLGDAGGPMSALEGYRWNVPVITYAFDSTFLRYFGTNGVNAVEEAIAILNALPPASSMSASLSEFALDTKGVNFTAATLGLLDVKSIALAHLVEQMGLANPERFVWALRDRRTPTGATNYSVIQLNYDPATVQESSYVNGVLYNYRIFDALGPRGNEWASAVEWYQLDPLYLPYTSVAGGLEIPDFQLGSSPDDLGFTVTGLASGEFFRGLTRDDAGGLRFLLSTNNFAVEGLLPDVFPSAKFSGGGSPWNPFPGFTNATGTNIVVITNGVGTNFVRTALRQGRDKITFQRVNFDSLLGSTFTILTNRYKDTFISAAGRVVSQRAERVSFQPDIVFAVGDLGTDGILALPFLTRRSSANGWSNNIALNTSVPGGALALGGPGVITPGILITFSDLVPYFANDVPGDQDSTGARGILWGSFDGTTQPPVVYPAFAHPLFPNLSLQYLQSLALRRKP